MSELEDRINSVLGNPEQMEKIANLAKSFMADGAGGESGADKKSAGAADEIFDGLLDAKMLSRISRLMQSGGEKKQEERALLEAMLPFLSEKRRNKMSTAIKIAKIAGIAKAAMGEMGDEGGD